MTSPRWKLEPGICKLELIGRLHFCYFILRKNILSSPEKRLLIPLPVPRGQTLIFAHYRAGRETEFFPSAFAPYLRLLKTPLLTPSEGFLTLQC